MGDTKERYERIRSESTAYLGGKCVRCGTVDKLEFDHVDPTAKSFDIAGGSRYSADRRKQELDKCQLLCEDCHTLKTREEVLRRKQERPHGTKTRYNQGCKCTECREAQRLRMAIYRATTPG